MRSEDEIFNLIFAIVQKDERIRAVYMNGSRTNPNVPSDIFQDFDLVFVVTETSSFLKDVQWIDVFGELLMKQLPDELNRGVGENVDFGKSYGYLMLFKDGNRIDLHLQTRESMINEYGSDKLTLPLLDKDGCLPPIPAPTDLDYHVKRPNAAHYERCTNNFWWCLQNVAKGIWRDELPYAKRMFEETIRASLDEMTSWWIGVERDFNISTGKMGKYFKKYLPISYWKMYEATYSDAKEENFWDSIFVTCDLFRALSNDVATHFSFVYPVDDDRNMTEYLKRVKVLNIGGAI